MAGGSSIIFGILNLLLIIFVAKAPFLNKRAIADLLRDDETTPLLENTSDLEAGIDNDRPFSEANIVAKPNPALLSEEKASPDRANTNALSVLSDNSQFNSSLLNLNVVSLPVNEMFDDATKSQRAPSVRSDNSQVNSSLFDISGIDN